MNATSELLLITQPNSSNVEVAPFFLTRDGAAVFLFRSERKGKLIGAQIIDQDCMVWVLN